MISHKKLKENWLKKKAEYIDDGIQVVKNYRNSIKIQKLSMVHIPDMLRVEKLAWPNPKQRFSKENFISQLKIFPDGCFGIYVSNRLTGMLNGLRLSNNVFSNKKYTWYSLTDNGSFRTHNKRGTIFFVASLSVDPAFRGSGLGKLLLKEAKTYVTLNRLKAIFLGSRMPCYKKFKNQYTPSQYFNQYKQHRIHDWLLKFYEKAGFSPKAIISNYFYDPDSCDEGVLMTWYNKK